MSVRALTAAGVALVLSGGAAAVAAGQSGHETDQLPVRVSVTYDSYEPPQLDVVTGDTVLWTNDSVRKHTVTAEDGTFGSDQLPIGGRFRHTFTAAGDAPYYCKLHPGIRGEVDVHDVLLFRPVAPAAPGSAFPLRGRTAHEAGETVRIQAEGADGFTEVGTAPVGPGGTFHLDITPTQTTSYRAVVGDDKSPSVELIVLNRAVATASSSRGRAVTIRTRVTPASPGATVVLQLYLPQRFGWWPVRRARLDRTSRAVFRLRLARRYRARVVLTLPDGATRLGGGPIMRVGPARPVK